MLASGSPRWSVTASSMRAGADAGFLFVTPRRLARLSLSSSRMRRNESAQLLYMSHALARSTSGKPSCRRRIRRLVRRRNAGLRNKTGGDLTLHKRPWPCFRAAGSCRSRGLTRTGLRANRSLAASQFDSLSDDESTNRSCITPKRERPKAGATTVKARSRSSGSGRRTPCVARTCPGVFPSDCTHLLHSQPSPLKYATTVTPATRPTHPRQPLPRQIPIAILLHGKRQTTRE